MFKETKDSKSNENIASEPVKQKKKYPRSKRVEVNDLKSALTLMESMIKQTQKLENSIPKMKTLSYLLQTYSHLKKTYQEETEIKNELISIYFGTKESMAIEIRNYQDVFFSYLGEESVYEIKNGNKLDIKDFHVKLNTAFSAAVKKFEERTKIKTNLKELIGKDIQEILKQIWTSTNELEQIEFYKYIANYMNIEIAAKYQFEE